MGSLRPVGRPVSIDLWKDIGVVCGSISALILVVGLLRQKVAVPVFETARLVAELVRQFVGDPDAKPPRPSLMDLVSEVREQQAAQAAEQLRLASEVRDIRAAHEDHMARDHRPAVKANGQRDRRI